MSKRKPPPSLGKLSPKRGKKIDKFAEWQLMKQEVDGWERLIAPVLRLQGIERIRVFAVGSPRKFTVVTKGIWSGEPFYKLMVRDIRTASHQHWMEDFIAAEWSNTRFPHPADECE